MDDLAIIRQVRDRIRAEITKTKADRDRAQREVEAKDQYLEKLHSELQGFESYLQRHPESETETSQAVVPAHTMTFGQDGDRSSPPPDTMTLGQPIKEGWDIPRIEAVSRVLREADQPLSPSDIVEALAWVGRDDTMKDVAAALTHLKLKRHRADNVARGLWVHVEGRNDPVPVDSEEPDVSQEVGM